MGPLRRVQKRSSIQRWAYSLSLTSFLFIFPAAVFANKAIVKSLKPPAQVQRASSPDTWVNIKKGFSLNVGDMIRTGKKGRVIIRMSDGSKMLLGPSSRLTVQEYAPNKIFGLSTGWLKSFIKKFKRKSKFKVKTPLAAASVRGTVFEIGYNESTKQGYLDVSKGEVALSKGGQEVLLHAGQRLDFLPDVPLGTPTSATQQGSAAAARSTVRREVGLGMSKEQVMLAAAAEMRLAEYQEGKTLIDVHGKRVRLEQYIIRQPKDVTAALRDRAFKLVSLNDRADRFDYFYYRGVFNTTLPDDLSLALNGLTGSLSATAPTYFLTEYEMGMSNTQDYIKDNASDGHLVQISYDGTDFTLTDPTDATNTRTITEDEQSIINGVTYHKIYDPVKDSYTTLTDAQYQAGDYRPVVLDMSNDTFRNISSGDTYWRTSFNSYSHVINGAAKNSYAAKSTVSNVLVLDSDADFTFAGGHMLVFSESPSGTDLLHDQATVFYGDGTKTTYNNYIISDEGDIGPVSSFANITTGIAYKNELLNWNYEQVISAAEFQGRTIDLVISPKMLIQSGVIK